jgi:hypothetical protein
MPRAWRQGQRRRHQAMAWAIVDRGRSLEDCGSSGAAWEDVRGRKGAGAAIAAWHCFRIKGSVVNAVGMRAHLFRMRRQIEVPNVCRTKKCPSFILFSCIYVGELCSLRKTDPNRAMNFLGFTCSKRYRE